MLFFLAGEDQSQAQVKSLIIDYPQDALRQAQKYGFTRAFLTRWPDL